MVCWRFWKEVIIICITQTSPRFQNQVIFCIWYAGGSEKAIYDSSMYTQTNPRFQNQVLFVVYGLLEVLKRGFMIICITQTNPRFQNQVNFCLWFAGGSEKGIYSMSHTNKSPVSKSSQFLRRVCWRFWKGDLL